MALSTPARLSALVFLAACTACGGAEELLPLIAPGDAVRVLDSGGSDCPAGWGSAGFDDHSWAQERLPLAGVPSGGVCLRTTFDVNAPLSNYRWLTIRLGGRSRARLNVSKTLPDTVDRGIDWSTDDDPRAPEAAVAREYTLDLLLFPSLLRPEGNLLALQMPQTHAPVDISAWLRRDDGMADGFVHVVKGPYRLAPSPTSTRIAWETDRSAPSLLVIDGRRYDGGWAVHHEVTVDGLVPGLAYSFYVASGESSVLPPECQGQLTPRTPPQSLDRTLSNGDFWKYVQRRDACEQLARALSSEPRALSPTPPDAPVRIAVVGETRASATMTRQVLEAVAAEAPDLVVHTGDVVEAGAVEPDWQAFFDAAAPLLATTPIAAVPGERDGVPWGDRFAQLFDGGGGRDSSLDLGPVHLALLDSTVDLTAAATWLDADLTAATARGQRYLFVVLHWGPYSAGPSGGNAAARAAIVPVARRHHVTALLSGHDRLYERGDAGGLIYFVTGGAGDGSDQVVPTSTTQTAHAGAHYLMIEATATGLRVRAKAPDGTSIDDTPLAP